MMRLFFRVINKFRSLISSFFARMYMRRMGVELGTGIVLHGCPIVSLAPSSSITIGDRTILCSRSENTALGVNHPVVLRTTARNARIAIGADVGMSGGSICAAVEVSIGPGTLLGANVVISDNDFHPVLSLSRRHDNEGVGTGAVAVGRNVFVGTGAIVMKGVTIGDNSVIGAGSVVTRSIPANTIAAGNPCRVLRDIEVNNFRPSNIVSELV